MKRSVLCVLPWLALTWIQASWGVEIMRWERLPLSVPLQVGAERVVFVERNVRVGVPDSLSGRLRVQSASGAVYLRAEGAIEPTRLQLQDADSGELILLDVFTVASNSDAAGLESIRIVDDSRRPIAVTLTDEPPAPLATPIPVVLTRYAAQNLYAPLRTVEALPGVRRVNIRPGLPLEALLPSLSVSAKALASWRLDDFWVTAIRVTNTSNQWVVLDPRMLQGNFISASFQHADMGPKGLSSDTTAVYLVTRGQSLMGALPPALSPFDAALNLPRITGDAAGEQ